jgi:hypothetical protein
MDNFNIEDFKSAFGIDIRAEQIRKKTIEFCRSRPGFFTPFTSWQDFGVSLVIPVFTSLGLGIISSLLSVASAVSGAVCLASLVTAGIVAAARKTDARNSALSVAAITGIITVVAPFISAIAAILVVVTTAVALTHLLTRTGATIVSSIDTAIQSCRPPVKVEDVEQDVDLTPKKM